jgi:cobalt-zinc-cadmium efflux system outer membrane protein
LPTAPHAAAAQPDTLAASPLAAVLATDHPAPAAPGLTLTHLLSLARAGHPALAAERSRLDGAQATVQTARALPNPELELLAGRQSALQPGAPTGAARSWAITQPLELPGLRRARRGAAEAELDSARADYGAFEQRLLADLKLRYFTVLRLQAEARNAEQDRLLTGQIHARVTVRVDSGESPRFELIRAETERLNAARAVQAAGLRVQQAQADLRRAVGVALPADFAVIGSIEDPTPSPPSIEALRERLLSRHPALVSARAELRAAEARLTLEQERRLPTLALRAAGDREPDMRASRLGVVFSVPLFDRREGPIGEAQATVLRLRSTLADREVQLTQGLEIAWQQYQVSLGQVAAYESGIVRQAESALRVAEAAYRYGERGILDYFDAQRAYRLVRNDLNAARYELRAALVDLERLSAEIADPHNAPHNDSLP